MHEFPHEVIYKVYSKPNPDGGGGFIPGSGGWVTRDVDEGFLDTPSSNEIYQAQQLQHPFDRNLYYPYRTDITPGMRVVCEGDTYEVVSKPMDQGGQNEIMKVPLKLVSPGG
ncbi:phage head closure protein [Jeotgalibacillus campisalis]|uniref:Phage head-tail adapter protein n=1 Tax=Jeotgalibacillus campisalis TaxID=220754 RepID=A0A0C2RWM7_9BACL|nr:phage head closure protein [Jeotgalibacillus campisalis]KIL46159.1 hypothetical protein KR50_28340 [Jeotgalibacillus campisalis]